MHRPHARTVSSAVDLGRMKPVAAHLVSSPGFVKSVVAWLLVLGLLAQVPAVAEALRAAQQAVQLGMLKTAHSMAWWSVLLALLINVVS